MTTPTSVSAVRPLRRSRLRADRLISSEIFIAVLCFQCGQRLGLLALADHNHDNYHNDYRAADADQHPRPDRHTGLLGLHIVHRGVIEVVHVHLLGADGKVLGDGLRVAGGILIAQRDDAADRARSIGGDVKIHAALGAGVQVAEVLVAARAQIGASQAGFQIADGVLAFVDIGEGDAAGIADIDRIAGQLQLADLKPVGLADGDRDRRCAADLLAGDRAGAGHVDGDVGHRAGKPGRGHDLKGDIAGLLGGNGADIVGKAAAVEQDILRQGQRDDDIVQILIAVRGVKAEREGERRAGNDAVPIAGGADEQIRRGGLVLVHALADRHAELLQRLRGIQIRKVDRHSIAAAVVDDIAEQKDVAVVVVLRVLGNLVCGGRAVADILQAGGVGVVVVVKQLANLADAGVGEHRRVDAGGDLLRLDAVPGRGVVNDLQHKVDPVADLNGRDLSTCCVGDGVGRHIDAVRVARVDGGSRGGRRVGRRVGHGGIVRQHRCAERRRQHQGGK